MSISTPVDVRLMIIQNEDTDKFLLFVFIRMYEALYRNERPMEKEVLCVIFTHIQNKRTDTYTKYKIR